MSLDNFVSVVARLDPVQRWTLVCLALCVAWGVYATVSTWQDRREERRGRQVLIGHFGADARRQVALHRDRARIHGRTERDQYRHAVDEATRGALGL